MSPPSSVGREPESVFDFKKPFSPLERRLSLPIWVGMEPVKEFPTKEMRCVDQIRDACSGWGFFQIVNHGVSDETMDAFYEQKQRFFALSKEEKARIKRNVENSKGWYDDELTKQRRDWKEGLDFGSTPTWPAWSSVRSSGYSAKNSSE